MESARPNRQSIRMKGWDYTSAGWYFITINTHLGRPLFGVIVNGHMVLNGAGRVAEEEWRQGAVLRKGIELDEFVVMPNHVHGMVRLKEGLGAEGHDASSPNGRGAPNPYRPQFGKPVAGSLGVFVGAYKAAVSREMGRRGLVHQARPHQTRPHQARPHQTLPHQARPIWHRNYWDVIVQDAKALATIRHYIRFNPQNYEAVMQCGEPRLLGNAALLALPKTGFLASRGVEAPHGLLPVKPGEAIISGFLSPMERAVFKSGLAQQRPLIWVKPWGLEAEALPAPPRRALDEGRLLIVSPFADRVEAPSIRRAVWCNQYALAHCDRLIIGHLNPGGMLACVLSEADPDMAIVYL